MLLLLFKFKSKGSIELAIMVGLAWENW